MNIALSYNWIKEYFKTKKSAADFAREFSLHSQTIDRIRLVEAHWQGVVTAQILEIEKHPNADKLRLATVFDGKEKVKVVCGAPNIEVGQIVPFVKIGGKVLDEEGKQWEVKRANIRGVESTGMLCSRRELGLGDDHTGIFVLPQGVALGQSLEKVLPVNDAIFEIEVTTNRPDCMSVVGLAREAGAVFGSGFKEPKPAKIKKANTKKLTVTVSDKKLCSRYQAIVMEGVVVGPSPLWLQMRLLASGIRPINNLVDITNYVLLEFGQPMHAFDYDLLQGQKILVRRAHSGETMLALDGNTYELAQEDLVIADADKPVAIAGVMGGENTGVTEKTKAIVFESATFQPLSVRKTSRRLNLKSESSNLFEKGLSPVATESALLRAVELAQELCGAKVASRVFDVSGPRPKASKIKVSLERLESLLGVKVSVGMAKKILSHLGCSVTGSKSLVVTTPWWRHDLQAEEDIVEEVARIYGYHKLPSILPGGALPAVGRDPRQHWIDLAKDTLVGLGGTEVYTYSLVSERVLKLFQIPTDHAVKLYNPLSSDMVYMRPVLFAGLAEVAAKNQGLVERLKIFELSKTYTAKPHALPDEVHYLGNFVMGYEDNFLEAKGMLAALLKKLGLATFEIKAGNTPMFEIMVGKTLLGKIGMVPKKFADENGLKKPAAFFGLNFDLVMQHATEQKKYTPLPEFPVVERDVALVLKKDILWEKIEHVAAGFDPLIRQVAFLSVYTGKDLGEKKSLAFRLVFQSDEKTLTTEAVDAILKRLIHALEQKFDAKLR